MREALKAICQFVPYLALALLGIFEVIDTTMMIVLVIVLSTTGAFRRGCTLPGRTA